MTKEETYKNQLIALGVWDDAFIPEVHDLCQLERELTRAKKEWSKTAGPGQKPSVLDKHYQIIQQLRRDILTHRESLGLTPKGLKRLVGELNLKQEAAVEPATVLGFVLGKHDAG